MPQNPEIRDRIIGQWQAGKTVTEIAASIPCTARIIRRWIKRFTAGGDHALHDHRLNNHCPRKTRKKMKLSRLLLTDPSAPSRRS